MTTKCRIPPNARSRAPRAAAAGGASSAIPAAAISTARLNDPAMTPPARLTTEGCHSARSRRVPASGGRADGRGNRREAVDAGPVVLLHVALDPVRAAGAQALALGGVHVRALARVVHERDAVAARAGDPPHLDEHDGAACLGHRRLLEGGLGEQRVVALG